MLDPSKLPTDPGVYLFKDLKGEIIYVGKAKNLKSRVTSYFKSKDLSPKTRILVSKIADADFIVVDSEVEALLLENKLIKQHSPKYNINLKDSKTFAYIKLTDEPYPRILSTRKVTKDGTYFGPYTSGEARVALVRLAISVFRIRTCKDIEKPCLKYHLGMCPAHDMTPQEYAETVKEVKDFLRGDTARTRKRIEEEMRTASRLGRYEAALACRKQLEALDALSERQKVDLIKDYDQDIIAFIKAQGKAFIEMFTIARGVISGKKEFCFDYSEDVLAEFIKRYYSGARIPREIVIGLDPFNGERAAVEQYLSGLRHGAVTITVPQKGEKLALVKLAEKNFASKSGELGALEDIKSTLGLEKTPRTIECFDISNLQYDYVVGAMTRFVDSMPDRKGYRKYKVQNQGPNDFAAIEEIVYRRYKRLKDEQAQMPDLIIIDGGKGQLGAALMALKSLEVKIPVIALAKQEEEIYLPGRQAPLRIDKNTRMMLLVRKIRDEVHRFAVSYNRKRRQMRLREQFKR